MPLKMKRNRLDWYRSTRVDGRVVSEYVASGGKALKIAVESRLAREARKQERASRQVEQRAAHDLDLALDDLARVATEHAETLIDASGWHVHKGCLRRRR